MEFYGTSSGSFFQADILDPNTEYISFYIQVNNVWIKEQSYKLWLYEIIRKMTSKGLYNITWAFKSFTLADLTKLRAPCIYQSFASVSRKKQVKGVSLQSSFLKL